jgi:hypothetical protein
MPTLTRKITPIGTLQTPKHRLNPIPLPQRPTLLPQTTQRPQTRTRTNPLRATRLHSHHRQPPHTLPTPPQACQTPIKLIAYPQRTRPHAPSHNASTTPPSNAPCSHKHPPTKLPRTRPPHPASSPTPPPSRENASAVSPPPDDTAPKRACHTPSWCRPPTPRASQSAPTAFLTESPVLPAKSAGRASGFRGWLGTERARFPESGGGLWERVAGRDRRGVGDRRRVGRLGGGRG